MILGDSIHFLEPAPDRGEPDQPVRVAPTTRYLSADLPILAMALMLAGPSEWPEKSETAFREPFNKPAPRK